MSPVTRMTVARYVWRCLRDEEVPRVSELAQMEGLTAEHLSRAYRSRYGERISDFMKAIQIRRAQRLLRTTDLSTTRIAYVCGFGTRRTFFRTYRRMTGRSPVEDASGVRRHRGAA